MQTLKYHLASAKKNQWALGQFNFSAYEILKGIVYAAKSLDCPIILGTSEKEAEFFGMAEAVAITRVLREKYGIAAYVNLDHGKSFETIKRALDAGYDMVHFDGSDLALEENIKISKELADMAKKNDAVFEGEIGKIGTKGRDESILTDPDEAQKYIKEVEPDLMAISIGNQHGGSSTQQNQNIDLKLLEDMAKNAPAVGFVLHGGSGASDDDVSKAVKLGIVKININTELRKAFAENLKSALCGNNNEIIPYKYMPEAIASVDKVVKNKLKLFMANYYENHT